MPYRQVLIQTYLAYGESSSKDVRARPLPGQGFDPAMHVACSSKMRTSHPVGTIFQVTAKLTNKDGGPYFLYSSWQWAYKVVSQSEADSLIAASGWRP